MVLFFLAQKLPASASEEKQDAVQIPIPIDPDAAPPLSFKLNETLSAGAKLDFTLLTRKNRDLDRADEDDQSRLTSRVGLAALFVPRPEIEIFGELGLEDRFFFKDGKERNRRERKGEIKRAYLLWKNALPLSGSLQLGRQRFKDFREWVYDEALDAVRILFEKGRFRLELSASSNLIDPRDSEDRIRNYIAYAIYRFDQNDQLGLYAVARRDRSRKDRDPDFVGASWEVKSVKNLKTWLEAASLSGNDGGRILRGYGFDIGASIRLDTPLKPSLTLGYAYGSGDRNLSDRADRNFRQTGLQDNQGKWHGVAKFKYYGELLDPELSNMKIYTVGLGAFLFKKSSVDLIYHRYSQVAAAGRLRNAGIKERPSGTARELGEELDLVFGARMAEGIQMTLANGLFVPGKAFARSDRAFIQELKIQIAF